jgi:hypothetical protein
MTLQRYVLIDVVGLTLQLAMYFCYAEFMSSHPTFEYLTKVIVICSGCTLLYVFFVSCLWLQNCTCANCKNEWCKTHCTIDTGVENKCANIIIWILGHIIQVVLLVSVMFIIYDANQAEIAANKVYSFVYTIVCIGCWIVRCYMYTQLA